MAFPMSLLTQITDDMKAAMKAKDDATLSTVRMLKAALKNKQIDLYGAQAKELSDEEVVAVVKAQIKQLKDAADAFKQGGREDMVSASLKEVAVLEKYLPAQMDDAALEAAVKGALSAAGLTVKADAGKAMGAAMKAVAGKADGSRVKKMVESILAAFVLGLAFHALTPGAAHAAVSDAQVISSIAYAMRVGRIILLLGGLMAVNTLLAGSFKYMAAGGNEDVGHAAHMEMINGLLGTIIIAGLFMGFTVALKNIGA